MNRPIMRTSKVLNAYLVVCFVFICLTRGVSTSSKSVMFSGLQKDKSILHHTISTLRVKSKRECALRCVEVDSCYAIAFQCDTENDAQCELKNQTTTLNPYTIADVTGWCYVIGRRSNTSTLQPAVTMETSSATETPITASSTQSLAMTTNGSSGDYIKGMIRLPAMCVGWSGFDIVVFTKEGIYIFDTYDDMTNGNGPCQGPVTFHSIFSGYDSNPVNIEDIECILVHNYNTVELYADNRVWLWAVYGSSTTNNESQGFPKPMSTFLTPSTSMTKPLWCTTQGYTIHGRYFKSSNIVLFYKELTTNFQQSDTTPVDVFKLNLWYALPDNVVSVTPEDTNYDTYIVLTGSLEVYLYQVNYNSDLFDPTISLTKQGLLRLH